MADEKVTPAPAPAPASGTTPAASTFTVPEKFAGKGVEDVAKAYVELERSFGEQGAKLKDLDAYSKLGKPTELQEAIDWARSTFQKITKGELVEAAKAAAKAAEQTAPTGPPWKAADWDYKSEGEKAELMAGYVTEQANRVIEAKANEYGQQINQYRTVQGNEQNILLEAINQAIKSGGKTDVQSILTNAAALASKTPQELLQMAVKQMTAGDDAQAEIDRKVNEKLAELKQKSDNESMDLMNSQTAPVPRFKSAKKSREDSNKQIIQKLRANGINLLA